MTGIPMANINVTVPLSKDDNLTFQPEPRLPPHVVTITDDQNPLNETGVLHSKVTRKVTLPPWSQATVVYVPNDTDGGEDINDDNDKDDNNDNKDDDDHGSNGSDYDTIFPPIPKITVTHGTGGPDCKN